MTRNNRIALAGLACCIVSSGCGGGGGGGTTDQERTMVLGNMVTRVVGTAQPPVSSAGFGSVVTGVAGANITALTFTNPSPTIDDTRIAFYAVGSQSPGLYVVSPTGLDPVRVWQNAFGLSEPTWSADGTRLLGDGSVRGYMSPSVIVDGNSNTVFTDSGSVTANSSSLGFVLGDGSVKSITTTGKDTNPAWWPSNRIVFESYIDGNNEIYTINADGTVRTRLTTNTWADTNPCWSPDGNKILYVSNKNGRNELYQMNATDGTSNTILLPEAPGSAAWDPQYSPDGSKICFVSSRDGNSEIYVCDVFGQNQTRLTVNTVPDYDPSWSPDSSRIIWTRQVVGGPPEVWTMAANGTGQKKFLSNAARAYWGPYVRTRTLIGTDAGFGTSASGILFGQKLDDLTSLLAFSASTPANARITALTPSGISAPNFVFDLSSTDAIKSLIFSNDFYLRPVTVDISSATNALVTFNSNTGKVSSVLPYTANRSAKPDDKANGSTVQFQRRFTGVWDATGKNLAPNGASEVGVDVKTGAVSNVR